MKLPGRMTDRGLTSLADEDLASLLLIRHFELGLLDLYRGGRLNGTTHTCLGQEYIPVAVCGLLRADDVMVSNHRGHGHYLSRYDDPIGLLAEIMGRVDGVCSGFGGSQHLHREGFFSSGVQGQGLPIAVGIALHLTLARQPNIAVVFMGDGTFGEGAVYEAFNMAALWRVPLLIVVENNAIAQSTPVSAHLAGTVGGRAAAFGIEYVDVDSTDVNVIRRQLRPLVENMRTQRAPLVVEFRTDRLGPHSKGDDVRPAEVVAAARLRDWYPRYADGFPDQFGRLDREAKLRMAATVRSVESQPIAKWDLR